GAALDLEALERAVDDKPLAMLYDAAKWEENLAELRDKAFAGEHFVHACAVKTNPLEWFLRRAKELGHGAECASISEVKHALDLGFEPGKVVFDSPCKTVAEIRFALARGVHLNMDNLQELERVRAIVAQLGPNMQSKTLGIRVNPLVGAGTIAAFSVSTGKSKFGVPLPREGADRELLLDTVVKHNWINCVHVHTGSGGMGLEQLVSGVETAVRFALQVNERAGTKQIRTIDMGGGLGVDYKTTETLLSDFQGYADALRARVPEIFDTTVFDRVVTEFGAAVQCKFAILASRVEYTKSYDGGRIALIHAGSDVFMRACYCPETFIHHRVLTFDAKGFAKDASDPDSLVPHDIAGPLCFAGDVVVHDVRVPPLEVDDIVVLTDVGGNSLSIRTTHCSRQSPPVYVFHVKDDGSVDFDLVQATQPVADTLLPWRCPS
ncbi:Diaminopimelate decarboxylase (DAP decarboxylase) (DAPDC), partial [Durusdinium trenchii]